MLGEDVAGIDERGRISEDGDVVLKVARKISQRSTWSRRRHKELWFGVLDRPWRAPHLITISFTLFH